VQEPDIAVFVEAQVLFPGSSTDESTFLSLLGQLSRDDALFTCARINAVVSGSTRGMTLHQRQVQAVSMLCTVEQKKTLSRYASRNGGAEKVAIFFRGQLLELAQSIVLNCENKPGDGETFRDEVVRTTFVRAALIASTRWQRRLFGSGGIRANLDPEAQLRQVLGAFRKSVEEGNQAGDAGLSMTRGWVLYAQFMPARLPEFPEIFQRATGLTIEQYFLCAILIINRSFPDNAENTRIFATNGVNDRLSWGEVFRRFMGLFSQSPEEWAKALKEGTGRSGYQSLRNRPILSFSGNRSIILDPRFYLENLTAAPLFRSFAGGESHKILFTTFGLAFEDYIIGLLRERFPDGAGILARRLSVNEKGRDASGNSFEIDAVLNEVDAAIVFEVKAAWIREEAILDPDPEVFLNEIRLKYGYVQGSGERPKGVAQLTRIIGAIARKEWLGDFREFSAVRVFYPVLTVFDERMASPGTGHVLEAEFRKLLGHMPPDVHVHRLIVLTAADLENLVYGVDTLSLHEFLRAYSAADPERNGSIHNFTAASEYLNRIRSSPILEARWQTLLEAARKGLMPPERGG
jgi:hypothetical protein